MRRDFDRIREILLECESSPTAKCPVSFDISESDVYQIDLMVQAGLIKLTTHRQNNLAVSTEKGTSYAKGTKFPAELELLWQGHEYLDAVRDAGIWEKTKTAVAETGGSATLEIMKALAIGFVKNKVAKHTDMEL